jgi:outer membrane receptor protein involved in Fe transport
MQVDLRLHRGAPAAAPRRSRAAARAALASLIILPAALAAQATGRITGTTVGRDDGAPLADVTVRVDGTARGTLTDAQGRFTLAGVPAGSAVLVAARVGLGAVRETVTVAPGQAVVVRLRLSPAATTIAPVTVSATREAVRRGDLAVTIDALDGAEIRRTRAAHPAQLLNRLAGVRVTELGGEGHSTAIRQPITTKPMYLYLEDGVPTRATGFFNHNALYEVNIPQSGGLEVLKGPGTALYGSDAIGGVINVLTRPAPPSPQGEVNLETGPWNYRRLLASAGTTRGAQGIRADLNLTATDTWREGAAYTRGSATIRHDWVGPAGWTTKTVVTGSRIRSNDVPALTQPLFDLWSPQNRAPIAYRDVDALRASVQLERERGASLLTVIPFFRHNTLDLLPNWQLTFNPQAWSTTNDSYGLLVKYRRDFAPLRTRVIVGADGDWSPGRATVDQIAAPRDARGVWATFTPTSRSYDYDVTYRQASPYLHTEFSPLARVRIDAGARYDVVGYDYDSRLAPLQTGPLRRPADTTLTYRRLSPKLGVTWDVTKGLNAYANWREGFRAPSQSQLFQQGPAVNTVGLRPVVARSAEVGVRGETTRLAWSLAAYELRITDDIISFITPENLREATNAGRTRHRGLEGALGVALTSTLRLDASAALAEHRYLAWTPAAPRPGVAGSDFSGRIMEQAPRTLGNALLAWSPRRLGGGRLAAEVSHLGRYAMDPNNAQWYGGFTTVNLHANTHVTPTVELFVRAVNVTNRRYAELAAFNPNERIATDRFTYTPGAPRSVFAGLRWSLR